MNISTKNDLIKFLQETNLKAQLEVAQNLVRSADFKTSEAFQKAVFMFVIGLKGFAQLLEEGESAMKTEGRIDVATKLKGAEQELRSINSYLESILKRPEAAYDLKPFKHGLEEKSKEVLQVNDELQSILASIT